MSSNGNKNTNNQNKIVCAKCGAKMSSNDVKCKQCGKKVKHISKGIIVLVSTVLIVIVAIIVGLILNNKTTNSTEINNTKTVKEGTTAIIKTTAGDIIVKFYPKEAPNAVYNFVELAKKGYYKDVIFHRIISGFMIQGGDPTGTGNGGESIFGKGFGIEPNEKLRHYRGALSTAKTSAPDSIGSQFFIVQAKPQDLDETAFSQNTLMPFPENVKAEYRKKGGTPNLDGGYTVFGDVIAGMDVVDKIATAPKNKQDYPNNPVKILSVTINEPK
jgi:cyclophilin family peptidyl-prolyl cis-trans isomerase/ribosomal protein L40E